MPEPSPRQEQPGSSQHAPRQRPVEQVASAPAKPADEPAAADASGADDSAGDDLRRAARIGDRRGLTATGAVALALVLGAAGGTYDVVTGPGLRGVFAVCFALGCAVAAATVHREDLRAAVVMPPLAYVVLAFTGGAVETAGQPGSFVSQQAVELANALFVRTPVLIAATLLALAVAVLRAVRGRRSTQPAG